MLTYFDLVESLIVSSYGGPQDAEQRDIRSAILKAYDELTSARDWTCYQGHGRVITAAPYQTGAITFNATTNQVTLTGGTFPAWATYGHVRVGTRVALISTRNSDTVLTLDGAVTFPEAFADQPYTLYRIHYPLPADFRDLDEPSSEYNWWAGLYVSPDQAMKLERVWRSTGAPYHWTVMRINGEWILKFVGYPIKVETVDFTYRRTPRRLRFSGHEAAARSGTIARSGTAVTLSGAASFVDAFTGSVLRVGDSTNFPGPPESLNPYVSESLIDSVTSSTALVTKTSGTVGSGTKYLITDPVDIAPHMQAAVDAACQYHLARIRKTGEDKAFQFYQRDLRLALERDQLAPLSGRTRQIYHDGGWRSPLKVDKGA